MPEQRFAPCPECGNPFKGHDAAQVNYCAGKRQERTRIVKWLRWKANLDSDLASRDRYTPGYVDAANAIERRDYA